MHTTALGSDHTVSLADWHNPDDPWGAYLVDHHPPQGHTIYVPYGQPGGPDVHACDAGSPGCYANGDGAAMHTTALGAGPEMYNNMEASHNCVGGSEQGCIPENPPVGDASKTGSSFTVPPPQSWYANGHGAGMAPTQALALPLAAADCAVEAEKTVCKASPGHLVMACHSFSLAAIQGVFKGDFESFKADALDNAQAMTPLGALVVRKMTA